MARALLLTLLVIALTGCGGDPDEAAAPAETVTVTETTTETVTETVTVSPIPEPSPTPTEEPSETAEPDDPYEEYRGEEGFVTSADFDSEEYGLSWPLTVDAGFLGCPQSFGDGAGSVTFTTLDGDEYALNGQAQHDYPDIRPITAKGEIVLPLIDAALELC